MEFHHKMVEKFGSNSFRANLHKGTAEKFSALANDLEIASEELDSKNISTKKAPVKKRVPSQLSLSFQEIEGLPKELIAELSINDADKTEFAILHALEDSGGIITLDRLLIALYRETGEIYKRSSLYSRLSRMASKGLLYYVPGKKGVYSAEQLSQDEAAELTGATRSGEDTDLSDDEELALK